MTVKDFAIRVRPSEETNDHEVVLLSDGQSILDFFYQGTLGLDPDEILVPACPLLSYSAPECQIGRCSCGVVGCGDLFVTISRSDDAIHWSLGSKTLIFAAEQYEREIRRALADHSWEPPDRTIARLVGSEVDRHTLDEYGLTYQWASARVAADRFVVSFRLEPGPYQVLLHHPWSKQTPPDVYAQSLVELLATTPTSWKNVEWMAQGPDLQTPTLAGVGWEESPLVVR